MKNWLRRLIACLLLLCLLPAVPVGAQEDAARELSGQALVSASTGFTNLASLFDGKDSEGFFTKENGSLTLTAPEGIGSLYIVFGKEYGTYTVTDDATGVSKTFGEDMYIHEFLDLSETFGYAPQSVTLRFEKGSVGIYELYAFTAGKTPDFVQKWGAPMDGRTDMILFSTHGDDEQIFFAGLLPYYAGELGYRVQLVYLTDHRNQTDVRIHETLNGLWAVGVDIYPVFGTYNDFFVVTQEQAYWSFNNLGWTREHLIGFVVEQLRRFKPQVVVGHDFDGEYGHGQHMAYADMLAAALEVSNNDKKYKESAQKYGVWDVPKAYFHLYKDNPIIMDWDQPLERFGGMTAFKVSQQLGYPCHESQYWDFAKYIVGYKSAEAVNQYNPREYGLYRSLVGEDVKKNDFFENIVIYAEQERIAEEQRQREEQARLEEEARQEALRREEEQRQQAEQQRLEEEKRKQEEQARLEEEARLEAQRQAEEQRRKEETAERIWLTFCLVVLGVLCVVLLLWIVMLLRKPQKRRKRKKFQKR